MDARQTTDSFLHHGKEMFHLLRTESEGLTDFDLQLLRSQLHLLAIETSNIQAFRKVHRLDGETVTYLEQLQKAD